MDESYYRQHPLHSPSLSMRRTTIMPHDGQSLLLSTSPPTTYFTMQSSQTTAQIGAPASTSGDMEPQSPTLADSGYSTIITHRKQQGDGMSDNRRIHTYPPEQYGCYSHPIHVFMASSLKNRSLSDSNNLNTLITQQENMMSVSDVKRHFDLAFAQQHTKNTFAPVGSTVPPAAVGHTGKTNVFPGLLAHVPDRHVVTQGMLTII